MPELLGDLELSRGDSYPLDMWIKNKATGERIDITGYSFIMTVDTRRDPDDASTKLFDVAGVVAVDQFADIGKVTFTPLATDTDQTPATYYYDIQMTYGPGSVYKKTIANYKFKIVQDITK